MREIKIGGQTYKFSTLSIRDYQEVYEEYKLTAPDPVDVVLETAAKLPETLRDDFIKRHLDAAFDERKRSGALNDPKFKEYLESADGAVKLVGRTLRKNHPHLTEEQAVDIVSEGVAEHGQDFLAKLVPAAPESATGRGRRGKGVLPG